MAWKEAAAQLGTITLISGLKALEATMKKRDFKRLVSTTAAQVLAVHPDVKPRQARRWARKATGTRAAKGGIGKKGSGGVVGAVEAAGAAAVTAAAAKVASKLAERPATRRRVAKALHPNSDSSSATAES
jgi:hypothetical protein